MKDENISESCIKLEKYMKRANVGSIIKSIILGLTAGFSASFVFSLIGWLTGFKLWWITFIILVAVAAVVAPLAYFRRYRPDVKDVARRLDRLGLEERVITMVDLEGVNTVMAAHQSASAITALGGVATNMLPVLVSGLTCISVGVGGLLVDTGMITVHALYAYEVIDSGGDIIDDIVNPDVDIYFTIRYQIVYVDSLYNETTGSGIEIMGNEEQIVLEGTDAEPVIVYIEDDPEEEGYGWIFLGWYDVLDFTELPVWEDGDRYGCEQDMAVTLETAGGVQTVEDDEIIITHYAIFTMEKMDGEPGDGEGEGEGDGEGEGEGDAPPDEPQDEEGDPSDSEEPGDSDDDSQTPGGSIGGGKYDPGNQIIDGNEYYRDHLEDYMAEYQQYLESGKEIPEYLKKFIETYYNIIK